MEVKIAFLTILMFTLACRNNYETYINKPANPVEILINERLEAILPNLKPMYGEIKKNEGEKAADKKFVMAALQAYNGDATKAAMEVATSGWYYFYKNIMDTAMFRFNQSWLIDSNYAASYFGFAAIEDYQGMTIDADKYYRLGYKHDPTDSLTNKYLHEIAHIKEMQQDTAGLMTSYYRVLSIFPRDGEATGKLGFFYSIIDNPDSTLKYYNLTIEFEPDYDQTFINRGWFYLQNHQTQKAIDDFTSAISKNKNSVRAYANRANALILDKQYGKAIPDLKQCVLLEPKYPGFHGDLAECYFNLNQHDEGCEELNLGIQKGGEFSDQKKQHGCN